VADTAVINASPLIFLVRGGHLDLLPKFFGKVLVPRQVADEIMARGEGDATAQALEQTPWLETATTEGIPASVESWGLGAGESAVIALALSTDNCEAVIDDLAGRKCAASVGVPVRGTLGIVLLAKKRGMIPAARPVLEDLLRGGMYLSRHVLDRALERVGE
jgi:predicted nucleic acid-binding protein